MGSDIRLIGSRFASLLLSALYPSRCPLCKMPADSITYAPLCRGCWNSIERYAGPSCSVCARPLVSEYSRLCGECFSRKPYYSAALSFGLYSGALREAIFLMKFTGIRRLARPLAQLLHQLPIPPMDGVVPVPLTKKTLRERGFNQTLLLARQLSKSRGIPLFMDALMKKKDTPPQIGLRAKERASNLRNAFSAAGSVAGRKLILIDDVMTTGATVGECAKTLMKAGAQEVVVVTLARASTDR